MLECGVSNQVERKMENRRELIDITSEVKSQIADIEVAPPLLYKTLFNDLLSKRDLVIEDEDKIVNSILDEKLSKLNIIQEDTSKHLSKLSGSTKKAMDAIKDKDEKKLNTRAFIALMIAFSGLIQTSSWGFVIEIAGNISLMGFVSVCEW